MIDVYKKRLASADWLAKETRDKADCQTLMSSAPHTAYPEKLPETYAKKENH